MTIGDAQIQATVFYVSDGGVFRVSRDIPTFVLPTDVLGLTSHFRAAQIAVDVVDPMGKATYILFTVLADDKVLSFRYENGWMGNA